MKETGRSNRKKNTGSHKEDRNHDRLTKEVWDKNRHEEWTEEENKVKLKKKKKTCM